MRALLLTLTTCLFILPAQAKYSGGTGEPNDPYQIATAADLIALGNEPNDYDKHFLLTADIDLDPNLPGRKIFDKAVIAPDVNYAEDGFQGTLFSGVFDGHGHAISHLTIKGSNNLGLFGRLGTWPATGEGQVRSLGVVDASIAGSGDFVGGLVGLSSGIVTQCYTRGAVTGKSCVGGLIGKNIGTVAQSYSTTAVRGNSEVGGLVGGNIASVLWCYSVGPTNGGAPVGGLIGWNNGPVTACFWDTRTSGRSASAAGVGLTTQEMYAAGTFFDWAICGNEGIWTIDEGNDYPRLRWENRTGKPIEPRLSDFLAGEGTQQSPYLINAPEELHAVSLFACEWDKHFKLMTNIDLSGFDGRDGRPAFNIIAPDTDTAKSDYQGTAFTGVFDGYGHTILHLTVQGVNHLGLFGRLASGAVVRDLELVDVNIAGSGDYVGALVGYNDGGGVTRCYSTGSVSGKDRVGGLMGTNAGDATDCHSTGVVSGRSSVGGLAGANLVDGYGATMGGYLTDCYSTAVVVGIGSSVGGLVGYDGQNSTVTQCYSTGAVSGADGVGGLIGDSRGVVTNCYATGSVSGEAHVGGLVGQSGGAVTNCYATGSISGEADVGGLVGRSEPGGTIANCYAVGNVSGRDRVGGLVGSNGSHTTFCYSTGAVGGSSFVGGLVGDNWSAVTQCYSIGAVGGNSYVGGLVGNNQRNVTASFWDIQTSGQASSAGGTGLTTAEMHLSGTFLYGGWYSCSEDAVWTIDEGRDYPRLRWENKAGKPIEPIHLSSLMMGSGTADDPYLIGTAGEFDLVGLAPCDWGKHFRLVADIDLSGVSYSRAPIAPDMDPNDSSDEIVGTPFTGVFDGNSRTITGLTIKGVGYLGVFGELGSGAVIKNLRVSGVSVMATGGYVGALVGRSSGILTGCCATGTVSGKDDVGGLVGASVGGQISQCVSSGVVSGIGKYVGGLVGASVGAQIAQCYSTAAVTGKSFVGGLVGTNPGTVAHCYSTGAVSGDEYVGGLVGSGSPETVTHSVWDTETSGVSVSAGGVGLTTAEMMDAYTLGLNGFAGDSSWGLDAGHDYPRLAWEGTAGHIIPEPDVSWLMEGQGTEGNPYRIDAAEQLIFLRRASALCDRHLVLVADIDLDPNLPGVGAFQYAVIPAFRGVFDGNGHTISHLTIKGTGPLGMFGHVASGGEVRDLGIADVNVVASGYCIGALAGRNDGTVTRCYSTGAVGGTASVVGGLVGSNGTWDISDVNVTNCYSTAAVSGSSQLGGLVGVSLGDVTQCHSTGAVSGNEDVGGLVGQNWEGTVTQCYCTGSVRGDECVGGLVGYNYGGSVTRCYGTGMVRGVWCVGGLVGANDDGTVTECQSTTTVSGDYRIGGLVGENNFGNVANCCSTGVISATGDHVGGLVGFNDGSITTSYSTGAVSGRGNAGGLVGINVGEVADCYSAASVGGDWGVGGLVGGGSGISVSVTDCFWDIHTSGQSTSAGGTGKTTVEMRTATTFLEAGWDFVGETANGTEDIWWILEGKDYPRLVWEEGPARVRFPKDADMDVARSPILRWAPGGRGLQHDVYFGEDAVAVANAIVEIGGIYGGRQSVETVTYDPGPLEWGKTYYWRIDEVNEGDPSGSWKGSVWSFTMADFIVVSVVDDFESYTDDEGSLIWETWVDGWYFDANHPGNGTRSYVGNVDPPFAEQTIVHAGWQSMPMDYNWDYNDVRPWYSEAERTWETPQDWTTEGADTLTLYFRGEPNNSPDPLYVGIEDSARRMAVVVHPDGEAVLASEWQKWHIAFGEVRAAGVDVAAVQKMVIGVGDRKNPKPGGTGRIYIDDIRMTKRMP